jgi:cyanophycin synthetase
MVQNILPAVLAAYTQNMKIDDIRGSLQRFIPSPATTPGRLNVFRFKHFEVLVDFAHNSAGFRAIEHYVDRLDATRKIGIFSAAGDRRDEDIVEMGNIAARCFDEIIIHEGKHLRGRSAANIIELLEKGFKEIAPEKPITIFADEREAITKGFAGAPNGAHITILGDVVTEALDTVQSLKEEEDNISIQREDIPNLR